MRAKACAKDSARSSSHERPSLHRPAESLYRPPDLRGRDRRARGGNPRQPAPPRRLPSNTAKMHRATTLVYESFRAEVRPAIRPSGRKVVIAPVRIASRRHRRYRWSYYASGLAAAACLGLLFFRLNSTPAVAPDHLTVASVSPAPRAAVIAPNGTGGDASPLVAAEPAATAWSACATRPPSPITQRCWPPCASRTKSSVDDGTLADRALPIALRRQSLRCHAPAAGGRSVRTYRAGQAEFTAFQFQR